MLDGCGCSEASTCLEKAIQQIANVQQGEVFINLLLHLPNLSSLSLNAEEDNLYDWVESTDSPMGKAVMRVTGALVNQMGMQFHASLWEVGWEWNEEMGVD